MNATRLFIATALLATASIPQASAQYYYVTESDTTGVPERAIIISGSPDVPGSREHIAVLYSREDLAFDDPSAPRFLFLDRQGKVAMGIGGYLMGIASYDVDGAIDGSGFNTYKIPVPFDPAQRSRLGADVSHSTLFLKLVARTNKLGRVILYLQTNFAGGDGGYGVTLKQAYMSVGNVTLGLTRSTFADGPSKAPTIDTEGPSGQITCKNLLVKYVSPKWKGFNFAVSAEVPKATYTNATVGAAATTASIAQRVPDIPAYVQYSWGAGSHVRLSGILRNLAYRDLLTGQNRIATGWGTQLSTTAGIYGGLSMFGHVSYGKGIGAYVNDLGGEGFDLIPDATAPGRLTPPATMAFTAGLQYNFTKDFFATASYSQAHLYDTKYMASDTYRDGRYFVANVFYNITGDLRVGAEYVHGNRTNISGQTGKANRLECMLQYSF